MGRLLQSENRSRLVITTQSVFKSFQPFKSFKPFQPSMAEPIAYPVLIIE